MLMFWAPFQKINPFMLITPRTKPILRTYIMRFVRSSNMDNATIA